MELFNKIYFIVSFFQSQVVVPEKFSATIFKSLYLFLYSFILSSLKEMNGAFCLLFILFIHRFIYFSFYLLTQSTLVISKSKGPSKTVRDIRTSTYQMCTFEENTKQTTKFHKWTCNLTPLIRKICWKYCGKGEKLLPRSNFSSFSQYFITWF